MSDIKSILNINESVELECKQAQGKDGNGELPHDFWPTYSAMANAYGGKVLLGVKERNEKFIVVGITNLEKIKKDLFNTLNNKSKVSHNILNDSCVYVKEIDGKNIIVIEIPQATIKQRPIYINGNPMVGTYIRQHEGDRRCSDSDIKNMLAEQGSDTLDGKIHHNFNVDDLDKKTLQAYRISFSRIKPHHPWLEYDDLNLMKALNGWKKDRKTGEEGLTTAGLLMFGSWSSIQEAIPNYFIEYQEQDDSTNRWVDRIVPDGTWSGNLFDFYRKVYVKLIEDLKVPFSLDKDGYRTEDSPIHEALREALVNTLVHSNYNDQTPIKIIKKHGLFYFRNPGIIRIPLETAKIGGLSDCRNKYLHQMFLMAGLGERAGSGLPKIYSGWKSQHWSEPQLKENRDENITTLELLTENMIPQDIFDEIKLLCSDKFKKLNEIDVFILSEAIKTKIISHDLIKKNTIADSRKITLSLAKLVKNGFLISDGVQKYKRYYLSTYTPITPNNKKGIERLKTFVNIPKSVITDKEMALEITNESDEKTFNDGKPVPIEILCDILINDLFLERFIKIVNETLTAHLKQLEEAKIKFIEDKKYNSNDNMDNDIDVKINDIESQIEEINSDTIISDFITFITNENGEIKTFFDVIMNKRFQYDIPDPTKEIKTYGEAKELEKKLRWAELMEISKPIREGSKRKVTKNEIVRMILIISARSFLTVRNFSELLGRNPKSLRRDYLVPLVKDEVLILAYPTTPTHQHQGYRLNNKILIQLPLIIQPDINNDNK